MLEHGLLGASFKLAALMIWHFRAARFSFGRWSELYFQEAL